MAGEAPAVNALRMEAQSLEEVLALLQAKVGALRGDGAETLSGDARRQLQGVARGALAALQQRQAGARSGASSRASSAASGGSVSSQFGGVFSRAASATSSVGARSSGGASIASIAEGDEEEAPSGLLAQLQLKSKQMAAAGQPQVGRPAAGSFTGAQSPNGSMSGKRNEGGIEGQSKEVCGDGILPARSGCPSENAWSGCCAPSFEESFAV